VWLRFYPRRELGKRGGNNPGAYTTRREDQDDAVERVEVDSGRRGFYHASPCGKKRVIGLYAAQPQYRQTSLRRSAIFALGDPL
jgi:hypothetical protein